MSGFFSSKYLKYRPLRFGSPRTIEDDRPCDGCGYNLRGLSPDGRCPECGREIEGPPPEPEPPPISLPAVKHEKLKAPLPGSPVRDDATCERCGYSLRGLKYGGACPECGTVIRYRRRSELAFDDMPLPLIRSFRRSCWIAFLAIVGLVAFLLSPVLMVMRFEVRLGLLVVPLGLWLLAVWRLTRPLALAQATAHGFSPRDRLRIAARWLQFGWVPVVGGLAAGWGVKVGPARPLLVAGAVGGVLGIIGIGVLALFLARLADWVRNEFAARAFTTAVWGTLIMAPLLVLLPIVRATLGPLTVIAVPGIVLLICLLLLISVASFPVGLFSLSCSIHWSVVYARKREDRTRQLRERMAPRPPPRPVPTGEIGLSEPSDGRRDQPPHASP